MENKIYELINGEMVERILSPLEIEEMQARQIEAEKQYWSSIPYDEAVNLKIRERYSESQEFAILRQKDEKPQEYAEYYAYCEECKNYVKQRLSLAE